MKRSPSSPQIYLITYRDGHTEAVAARTCMRIGNDYVFYTESTGDLKKVPADSVLSVGPSKVRSGQGWQRRA